MLFVSEAASNSRCLQQPVCGSCRQRKSVLWFACLYRPRTSRVETLRSYRPAFVWAANDAASLAFSMRQIDRVSDGHPSENAVICGWG